MIEQIVTYLDNLIAGQEYFARQYGLVELIDQGDTRRPMLYCSKGVYKELNYSRQNGSSYWRLTAKVAVASEEISTISCKKEMQFTYPLRIVAAIKRSELNDDNQYSVHRFVDEIIRLLSAHEKNIRKALKARKFTVTPSAYDTESARVFSEEYAVVGREDLDKKYAYFSINFSVFLSIRRECMDDYCDPALTDCQKLLNVISTEDLITQRLHQGRQ